MSTELAVMLEHLGAGHVCPEKLNTLATSQLCLLLPAPVCRVCDCACCSQGC